MALRQFTRAAGLAVLAGGFGAAAQAEGISPSSFAGTLGIGESITIHKTVTVATGGATEVEIFFLADNTGSMSSTVNAAKTGATTILNNLPNTYKYGVGHYYGDLSEGCGASYSCGYHQLTAFTSTKANVQAGINAWNATGGGDTPEANFYALKQVADTAGWNPAAQHLVVWFGDAAGHTNTTTFAQAVSALQGIGAKVIAFNNTSAGFGIDGNNDGEANQASRIIAQTGGNLTNNFNASSDFVSKVTSEIVAGTSFVDLSFGTTFLGDGLSISFTCTDALGCNHVGGGESRSFDVTITGLKYGTYDFNVFASGVGPQERDLITVVPEPETYALMLAGLGILGAVQRRRNRA
ncbi:MAG: PEP-CTERM sorting domain-containing protein [Rhodocyclaceae bacterium]|nr:PEP-CTERM sorting domain-containing protein [Rhodocyclaceae bacterium]